jgi:hypothetical protein
MVTEAVKKPRYSKWQVAKPSKEVFATDKITFQRSNYHYCSMSQIIVLQLN